MPSWTLAMAWLNFIKNQHVGAPGLFTAFLGTPVRFQVLTTQLFRTLNGMISGGY